MAKMYEAANDVISGGASIEMTAECYNIDPAELEAFVTELRAENRACRKSRKPKSRS
jgi:hypothetical protein